MKVLFTTNILSFYRVNFFNELGKNCDLTVMYENDKDKKRNKKFFDYKNDKFRVIKAKFSFSFMRKLIKNNYDIIVIGTYATPISALLILYLSIIKKKFVINADGGIVPQKESKLSKKIKAFFISKASYYLSTGKETNKYLEYYGADKNKLFIYRFSSLYKADVLTKPISYDDKLKLRKEYGITQKQVFLSVGQFIYRKGYDLFLESLSFFNNFDILFIIISGGEERDNYLNYMNENNISNVLLIDYCEKDTLKNYYKLSDAFFFPSREDIWGLVINEAMSFGLPIISSNNVLASKELLEAKFLYRPEDINSLAKLNEKLFNMDISAKERIGKRNLKKIKDYTIEQMAIDHIKIFKDIVNYEKNK